MFIASVADEKYAPLYAAMLHSCWLFNPDARYGLIDAGMTKQTKQWLKDFASDLSLDFQLVDRPDLFKRIEDMPNQANFIRLFIPEIFPNESRVIYLDGDISVLGELIDLFETDLEGHAIAAIPDSVRKTIETETEAHGIDFGDSYFNSGVLLIDCKEWMRRRIAETALAYWRLNRSRMKFNDQAALNGVLRGDFKKLDQKWNFFNLLQYIPGQDIRILHHTYHERPWTSPRSPFVELHRYHRSQTPWPLSRINQPLRLKIRDHKRFVFGAMGMQKYRPFYDYFLLLNSIQDELGKTSVEAARAARNRLKSMTDAMEKEVA